MNRTIFLAEDDIDDQELLEDALQAIAPDVILMSFISGVKFIQTLEATDNISLPNLIVLDYNIPEINGAEILQHLNGNERYQHITKIIWSTSNSEKYKSSCLSLGAKDYVIKPSTVAGIQLLAEKLLSFLNDRER